jgi:hypothetical protein
VSKLRPVLALGVCAALAAATGVAAAAPSPKPVCNLLTDAKGDGYPTTAAEAGPSDDALDILSADVATNAKQLTAVLRLSKAATSADSAPTGFRFLVLFTTPGSDDPVYLSAASTPGLGETYSFGTDAADGLTDGGEATGVFDAAKNEVRITASLSDLSSVAGKLKPGTKLTGLNANSSRDFQAVITYADRAEGGKTYVAGTPSCVAVGK